MMIVGLTGGIGSGKSTVANMFRALGVPVYDSDKEAKLLMNSSKKIKKDIIELLGKDAYIQENLNKAYISSKVFSDSNILEKLNSIVHPEVRKDFLKWAKKQNVPYVIQESAIIFENNNQDFYDYIILVTAPIEDRIQRIIKRDTTTRENILARIENQWSDLDKKKLSDFIVNNKNIIKTKLKIKNIHNKLINSLLN